MKSNNLSVTVIGPALVLASAFLFPAGCGEDRPEAKPKAEAVEPVERGPATPEKAEAMPRTRYVKDSVNQTMDKEAEKRARQMKEIFR